MNHWIQENDPVGIFFKRFTKDSPPPAEPSDPSFLGHRPLRGPWVGGARAARFRGSARLFRVGCPGQSCFQRAVPDPEGQAR